MNKANINDTHRVIITDPRERRALLQNETVMNQLLRSANKRMGSFESMRALLTNNF
ncbi:MAG: hypothetical protein LBG59_05055 [Candidatus Peribacteria bacterium]|jgi:hypothetical protein|nr:hypothetical protein [Candidatus Peribacteria bacterium]